MNSKGFTLVELLITIALLGIIVTISFVSINGVIEKSKENDCQSTIDGLKSAASEYVSDNRYNNAFVNTVGEDAEGNKVIALNASSLVDGNYLNGDIINPYKKTAVNPSNITINIVLYDDYTLKSATILEEQVCQKN